MNGLSLIAVVMRAPSPTDRVSNAKKLLDYGFSNYEFISISNKDEVVQNVAVSKGITTDLNLVYSESTGTLVKRGSSSNLTNEIILNENISAPVNKGDTLGKVNFYLNEELIATVDLIAEDSVKKMNSMNMFEHISTLWSNLLR